jgi:hypothetical protein
VVATALAQAASRCEASVTIHTNVATGHLLKMSFFVTGAAVVPHTRAVPFNVVDKLEVAAARALGNQLPFSWPEHDHTAANVPV